MITARPVKFREILLAISARLALKTPVMPDQIGIVANTNPLRVLPDRQLYIRPHAIRPIPGSYTGGGRVGSRFQRLISILINNRYAVDTVGSDLYWLTHEDNGSLVLEEAVINALLNWFPLDSNGKHITERGLTLTAANEEENRDEVVWGGIKLRFEVTYIPDIVGEAAL